MANSAFSKLSPPLNLPAKKRPAWVREQGIVMAGNWEPLINRSIRYNGTYEATPHQIELYKQEHTPEMVKKLAELGVNFIMTHAYKGGGMAAEKAGMDDAARLAKAAHKQGMHVGVYIFSGTLLPDVLRKEIPESKDWEILDEKGNPIYYGDAQYRHFLDRNHPAGQEHLKQVIKYAVEQIGTDLLHFDNYVVGPGYDDNSVKRFRAYLKKTHRPEEFGLCSFDAVMPPSSVPIPAFYRPEWEPETPLHRAWMDFSCDSFAQSFADMTNYARSLKPDILSECNPGPFLREASPLDHGRILRYGEAIWIDVLPGGPGKDGITRNYIQFYKLSQAMDNITFAYITRPTHAAEALAYNTDCLGCITWFEWGRPVAYPNTDWPISPDLAPYVSFFHEKRPYYIDAERRPDIGVLRSYRSHEYLKETAFPASDAIEKRCIEAQIPWMPVFDQQLGSLKRFAGLSIVGADVLTSAEIEKIRRYVENGGGLIYATNSGRYDEKLQKRERNPFMDLSSPRVVRLKPNSTLTQFKNAVEKAMGRPPSLIVDAPSSLSTELTEQKALKRRLVHLVNYKNVPVTNVRVAVSIPKLWKTKRVMVLRPEAEISDALEFRQEGEKVVFTVPQVNIYSLISVEAGK